MKAAALGLMAAGLAGTAQGQKLLVTEFRNAGGDFGATGTDAIEILLLEDFTAAELGSIRIGDSQGAKNGKQGWWTFTGMSAIASTFRRGTMIAVGGSSVIATEDLAYDPANGDWNLSIRAANTTYLTAGGTSPNIGTDDIVWVDDTTGNTITPNVGFALEAGTGAIGTFNNPSPAPTMNGPSVQLAAYTNGVSFNQYIGGMWTAASFSTGSPAASLGQPGGTNPTYGIDWIRGTTIASDRASDATYASAFSHGAAGGTGWSGGWALSPTANDGNRGFFVGTSTGNGDGSTTFPHFDIDAPGAFRSWGLYSNGGVGVTEAVRTLATPMQAYQQLHFSFDPGNIDAGGSVGLSLRNASGNTLCEVLFRGGQANFETNGGLGFSATTLPFTDEGVDVVLYYTTSGFVIAVMSTRGGSTVTGLNTLLSPAGGQVPAQVRLFNFNAGSGSTKDAYFNNIRLIDARPEVQSINRSSSSPTNASSVNFAITFNEAMTTVNAGDFGLTTTGVSGASISSVTGSGRNWTAAVNTGSGDGTIQLNCTRAVEGSTDAGLLPIKANFTGETYTIDKTAPSIPTRTIQSDNPTPSLAAPGDDVTVTFTTSEAINTPAVQIGGSAATVSGGPTNWTATRTMTGSDTEGLVTLLIAGYTDPAGNTGAAQNTTSNGSTVTFDKTAPAFSAVGIASNNADATRAKTGDTVTVSFTTSEAVATPSATIAGGAATVSGGPTAWTATRTMTGSDPEGTIAFSVGGLTDLAGNASGATTTTTDSSAVVFDRTAPAFSAVGIASNNPNSSSLAKVGDVVSVSFTTSESVATPSATIAGSGATVTGGPTSWTAARTLMVSDPEGTVAFSVGGLTDLAGNASGATSTTTDSSAVVFDRTAPAFGTVAIASNNANSPSLAKLGDTLTISFTTSEAVSAPTATIAGAAATVSGGPTSWTASRAVVGGDPEGGAAISISGLSDAAGNVAGGTTSTSDSSTVLIDLTAPSEVVTTLDATQVGTSVAVNFAASDAGSGLASTALWVRTPGSGSFADSGLSLAGGSGSFSYTAAGDGAYEFAALSADAAGNIAAAPSSADVTILVNTVANSSYAHSVGADGTYLFPMTASQDVELAISGFTGAPVPITVARTVGEVSGATLLAANLVDESLQIAGTLGTATATLTWPIDPASDDALSQPFDRVYQVDGGALTNTFTVSAGTIPIVVPGIAGFSDWYAGFTPVSGVADWELME